MNNRARGSAANTSSMSKIRPFMCAVTGRAEENKQYSIVTLYCLLANDSTNII